MNAGVEECEHMRGVGDGVNACQHVESAAGVECLAGQVFCCKRRLRNCDIIKIKPGCGTAKYKVALCC